MNALTPHLTRIRDLVWTPRPDLYPVPLELVPDTLTATARRLDCGDGTSRTYLLVGYPGAVPLAWTQTLLDCGAWVDVSCHLGPIDTAIAVARLRRRRARLESSRRHSNDRDQLDDPAVEAAAADAAGLAGRLATGDTRMYSLGVYVTVHAPDADTLERACARFTAHAAATMLDVRPATWRQLPGITSTLPLGVDALGATRTTDSDVVAAAFPLVDPDTPASDAGVVYGLNMHTGAPVIWDRWACENHNSVVIGRSGSGKSYFAKTEVLRQLYDGVEVHVIDPDGEYQALADYVDGTTITPGTAGVGLNPLALPATATSDALTRRIMFAATLTETLLGEAMNPDMAAALDKAVRAAYSHAGITDDPSTWHHTAPTLADVTDYLRTHGSSPAGALASQLHPYTGPHALADVFRQPSVHTGNSPLTVYQFHQLPDELLAAVTLAILDRVWNQIIDDGTRRLIVVDESWLLLRTGRGTDYLSRISKSARKRNAGLMCVTQDCEDMAASELGRIIIANAATAIVMRQSPQAAPLVADAFGLTAAESDLVTSATRGEALLRSGDIHTAFTAVASDGEDRLMRTGMSGRHDQ